MPRPTTKNELVSLSDKNYQKLNDFIDQLLEIKRQSDFPEGTLNRNISDVICHLHHWHLMVIDWYKVGMTGEKPDIPAKGYTWKTVPDLNREIQKKYSGNSLEKSRELFAGTHKKMSDLINKHSDEELFEKKRYKWTGTTSLGAYLISATSSHYDWAYKLIKKCTK
ncbi:ClbS/DfsB family four-helix bundle protein [Ekhidna sp.]